MDNEVFISYSRRDKVFTQKLYEALKAANRVVWADWDSIPAASDWDAEIKEGIQHTESVLFVLSPEWLKSNECRKELNHAVAMGKRLFPILYLPVNPSDVPPELAKINWVYMRDTDDFEQAFKTLCSAMDTDLDWAKAHTRLQVRAVEWDRKKRDHSFTLQGKDLADAEQFLAGASGKDPEPTALQGEYILASRRNASRRQRNILVGVTIALVISVVLGVVALIQRGIAVTNERISFARELTAEGSNNLNKDPERSILLGLQAVNVLEDVGQPVLMNVQDELRLAVQNSRLLHTYKASDNPDPHASTINSVAFSRYGKYIVSGSTDKTARVWEAATGREIARMTYKNSVYSVAFSQDEKYVASGSLDHNVDVWEAQTGKLIAHMTHDGEVWGVAFSPDGKRLATVSDDKTFRIWEIATRKEVTRKELDNQVHGVVYSPDGKSIATTSYSSNGMVQIWDAKTGALQSTFTGGMCGNNDQINFSPDGSLIGVSGDCTFPEITILHADKPGEQNSDTVRVLSNHAGTSVKDFKFSPDGTLLASAGEDFTVVAMDLWDGSTKFKLYDTSSIYSLDFSHDGKYIVTGNEVGQLKIWDAAPAGGDELGNIDIQRGAITTLEFSPDGPWIATTTDEIKQWSKPTEFIWPLKGGDPVQLSGHTSYVNDLAFSSDGKKVVTGSSDCTVRVWDASTGSQLLKMEPVQAQECADHPVTGVSFSPDGKYISGFVGDATGKIGTHTIFWDATTGKQDKNIPSELCGNFSPDGSHVRCNLTVSEFPSGNNPVEIGASYYANLAFDVGIFSPDGTQLLFGDDAGKINLWDAGNGELIRTFSGHASAIMDLAFNQDGSLTASASQDRTAKIWNASTGELLATISPSAGPVKQVKFSSDDKMLALGTQDGVVRFYYVDFKDVLEVAKTKITRSFTEEECQIYLHEPKCPANLPEAPLDVQVPAKVNIAVPVEPTATAAPTLEPATPLQPDNTLRGPATKTAEAKVTIINSSGVSLNVVWIDENGKEQLLDTIDPGGEYPIDGYVSIPLRAYDQAGNLWLEYVATDQATQVLVIGTDMKVTVK